MALLLSRQLNLKKKNFIKANTFYQGIKFCTISCSTERPHELCGLLPKYSDKYNKADFFSRRAKPFQPMNNICATVKYMVSQKMQVLNFYCHYLPLWCNAQDLLYVLCVCVCVFIYIYTHTHTYHQPFVFA
jgi:hypothetical protein